MVGSEEGYGVACTKDGAPSARSVFTIEKVNDARRGQFDKIIRYGDKVRILANDQIFGVHKKMYLKSQYTSTQSFARMSHFQEVTVTVNPSSATLWEFEPKDPRVKFTTVGEPVMINTPLLIKHSNTVNCLGTDNFYFK